MSKILFVNIYIGAISQTPYHTGIAALSASCQQEGFETEVLSITRSQNLPESLKKIENSGADILCFSISSPEWPNVCHVLDMLKNAGEKRPVVVGGYHPTIKPEEVISHPLVKYLFLGEVDEIFPEFLSLIERDKEPEKIPNLWWKKRRLWRTRIVRNPLTYLPENLDALPVMDREIFLREWQTGPETLSGMGGLPVMAGRGCPFACGFCCNSFFKRLFSPVGRYVRKRSPLSVVKEMRQLLELYDPPAFELWDELFAVDRKWTEEFCSLYQKNIPRPYSVLLRADLVDENLLERLYESGCRMAMFGVETGNEEFRRKVLGKNISNAQIIKAFRLCKEFGIEPFAFVVVGFPEETPELLRETIEFCRKLKPSFLGPQLFYPLPGTPLAEKSVILPEYYQPHKEVEYFVPRIANIKASPEQVMEAFEELLRLNAEFSSQAQNWVFNYQVFAEKINPKRNLHEN